MHLIAFQPRRKLLPPEAIRVARYSALNEIADNAFLTRRDVRNAGTHNSRELGDSVYEGLYAAVRRESRYLSRVIFHVFHVRKTSDGLYIGKVKLALENEDARAIPICFICRRRGQTRAIHIRLIEPIKSSATVTSLRGEEEEEEGS